eukprot:TRINITY_DN3221_c0_g1_i8.p1 TRINITY_DN3221_c0_g1~~TRINITY_DN3221_c0_g1_i8.p1  ORF type:complete len:522 (+),score=91.50 TRINITY_DN3221_c0_g1_i8:61-1626(+)
MTQSSLPSNKVRRQINKEALYQSLINEVVEYEPEDVVCRSQLSYETVHKYTDAEGRRKVQTECGWAAKRHSPYKCLGDPILDSKSLEYRRREFEWELRPQPIQPKPIIESSHLPTLKELDKKPCSHLTVIQVKLNEAEERLKSPRVSVPIYDLLPDQAFLRKMTEIGQASTPGKTLDDDGFSVSNGEGASPYIRGQFLPLGEGVDNLSDPSKTPRMPTINLRPLLNTNDHHRQKRLSTSSISSSFSSQPPQSARGSEERRGKRTSMTSARGSVTSRVSEEPHVNQFSILIEEEAENPKMPTKIVEEETRKVKSSPVLGPLKTGGQSPQSPSKKKDSGIDLKAIRLRAMKEQILDSVKDKNKSNWYITLLAIVHDGGRQVTQQEEVLMNMIERISSDGLEIPPEVLYGILKTLPLEIHLSQDVQRIVTYMRQEVLKIPPNEFRAWLMYNSLPIPDALQTTAMKSTRTSRRNYFHHSSISPATTRVTGGLLSSSVESHRGSSYSVDPSGFRPVSSLSTVLFPN